MKSIREEISGKRILVTGATGLIGKALIKALLECEAVVYAVVRDRQKALALWGDRVTLIESDVTEMLPENRKIDYVIHGAAITSSRMFVEQPAEVIHTNILGTVRMLEFARANPVKAFVFLSTMEVYGNPDQEGMIDEKSGCCLDTMAARSSYPESKRMCENLCAAYCAQFRVPVKAVRLAQTFGEGADYQDPRVFAEFARCVIENRDIILRTAGETKRCYLSVNDAVRAILLVMIRGEISEAYNAANEETYCSIREMAEMVCRDCAGDRIRIRYDLPDNPDAYGYAPVMKMKLSSEKLRRLGWEPQDALKEIYQELIRDMRNRTLDGEGEQD